MKLLKRRNSHSQRTGQIAVPTLGNGGNVLQQSEKPPRLPEGSHVGLLVIQLAPLNNKSSSEEAIAFMADIESSLTDWLQISEPPEGWSGKLSFLKPDGPADCGLAPVDITCSETSWEVSK